jgi:hypothetical protein
MRAGLLTGLLLAACLQAGAAVAQPAPEADADWPCPQARTPTISAAAIWSGPDIAQAGAWDDDSEAAALAQKLASRRTPLEDVDPLLDDFVAKAGTEKDVRLTRVFAGMLELINRDRSRLIAGIVRYAQGQNKLAAKLRQESNAVSDAQEADAPEKSQHEQQEALQWDKRIFEERSRSLAYVCEAPGFLEKRAFEIARRIQQRF